MKIFIHWTRIGVCKKANMRNMTFCAAFCIVFAFTRRPFRVHAGLAIFRRRSAQYRPKCNGGMAKGK
jgi:hypothetical protein